MVAEAIAFPGRGVGIKGGSGKVKNIVFVGKLNISKGYDLYKDAILKILDEFKDWKALSIGDENRDRSTINHRNEMEVTKFNLRDYFLYL